MKPEVIKTINCNQGTIYVFDNGTCLKRYKTFEEKEYSIFDEIPVRISKDIVTYFTKFNNNHFCKILKLFSDEKQVNGYLMPYYNEISENLLDFDDDYIKRNIKELYDIALKLAYDRIRIVDLNPNNLILTKENIVIIDFDKYRKEDTLELNVLIEINTSAVIYALEKKIEKSLKDNIKFFNQKQIITYIEEIILSKEIIEKRKKHV